MAQPLFAVALLFVIDIAFLFEFAGANSNAGGCDVEMDAITWCSEKWKC